MGNTVSTDAGIKQYSALLNCLEMRQGGSGWFVLAWDIIFFSHH